MIDGIAIPDIGLGLGWVVAFLFVVALLRGRLATRSALDDVIHDRDEWRAESRIKDAQITEKDQQLRHMGEVGRTAEAILGALQRNAAKETP